MPQKCLTTFPVLVMIMLFGGIAAAARDVSCTFLGPVQVASARTGIPPALVRASYRRYLIEAARCGVDNKTTMSEDVRTNLDELLRADTTARACAHVSKVPQVRMLAIAAMNNAPESNDAKNEEACSKLAEAVMRDLVIAWPNRDGGEGANYSASMLFLMFNWPSTISVLGKHEAVLDNWLGQLADLSFTGLPKDRTDTEEFRKQLIFKLGVVDSPTAKEMAARLSQITFRVLD